MEPSTSSSGDVEPELIVFLSHSRKQKLFVELLDDRLEKAQQTAFFDKKDLKKASYFPADIKTAVRDCELGVLVLSHDYLSSKWPMLELGWLVSQKKRILPLFYQVTVQDLKCTDNLSKWKQQWTDMVGPEEAELWNKAVKTVRSINGVVYQQQGGELAYIEEVVTAICDLIRPNLVYDLSYVRGQQRLAKVWPSL